MQGNKIRGIVCAVVASGTFGLIPLFSIPLMESGMGELSVLFYRCLFSAAVVGVWCMAGRKPLSVSLAAGGRLAGMSVFYCSTAIALLLSYNYMSSGVVTTIHFLYPVMVALLMALFYRERCSGRVLAAAGVTMIGVASLSWTGDGFAGARGILLALSTAVTYALYIVAMNRKEFRRTDSRVILFYILTFAALIFGGASLATGGIDPVPGTRGWLNLAMLALLPTVVSNIALIKAVRYAGATTTSILGSAEPLVAVIFGVFVFSERFTVSTVAGLAVIIAAVTYIIVSGSRENGYA